MHNFVVSPFDAAAILIVLAAGLGYLNHRYFKLSSAVGMTIMGSLASLIVVAIDSVLPGSTLSQTVQNFLSGVDFHKTLMEGMLSFLLFAGALHVDWSEMRKGQWPILVLSTVGTIISTVLVGFGFSLLTKAFGLAVPLPWCFVFGALISPTDPVAVMGVLKRAAVPPTLQATLAGESLFNDGVGIVIFSIVLGFAMGTEAPSAVHAITDFLREAGGGVALGLVTGWLAYRAMQSIDDYIVEVMISLAVVMGGYSFASFIGVSGPVAMAVAGLLIGNHATAHAMSDVTLDYMLKFWALIDEIFNAVLFLLIGLEVIAVARDSHLLALGLMTIPLALAVRWLSVGAPLLALRPVLSLGPLAMPTLIWGGLRGGISVALALSLPEGPTRTAILVTTYAVVMFSVIVQGSSVGWLVDRLLRKNGEQA